MAVSDLEDTQWTLQPLPDGRLEAQTLRKEMHPLRFVAWVFLYPPATGLTLIFLARMIGPSFPLVPLLWMAALGWLALFPWVRRPLQKGERLLAGLEGVEMVSYQYDKITRQGWVFPQKVEVRRKTAEIRLDMGEESTVTPIDAWCVMAVSKQGETELLWARERERVEEAAARLTEVLNLQSSDNPADAEQTSHAPATFEGFLPVPASCLNQVTVAPAQVAFLTRTFLDPRREKASLVILGIGGLVSWAVFQAGSPLVMVPFLFFFALSIAVCGPQLKEHTVLRREGVVRLDHLEQHLQSLFWGDIDALESDGERLVVRPREGSPVVVLDGLTDSSRPWVYDIAEYASGLKVQAPQP